MANANLKMMYRKTPGLFRRMFKDGEVNRIILSTIENIEEFYKSRNIGVNRIKSSGRIPRYIDHPEVKGNVKDISENSIMSADLEIDVPIQGEGVRIIVRISVSIYYKDFTPIFGGRKEAVELGIMFPEDAIEEYRRLDTVVRKSGFTRGRVKDSSRSSGGFA